MFWTIGVRFRQVETVCAVLLLSAIVILVAIASLSRGLNHPIIWSIEVSQLCFVWLCIMAADLAMQHERHFGLSVLSDKLSDVQKVWLELFNRFVLIVLLGFLLTYAVENAILMRPRLVGATQMSASYYHASMVVGFALLLRTMIMQTFATFRRAYLPRT